MSFSWRRALVSLAGCLLLAGCASGPSVAGSVKATLSSDPLTTLGVTRYPAGQRPSVPDLSGRTLDGSSLALSSLRGHVVVLNAWASWCTQCRTESAALARIARQTAPMGARFVGLDESDQTQAAQSFAAQAGTSYPHLVDRDGAMLASLRIVPPSAIPSTLVLDPQGHVTARVIGAVDASTLAALVRQAGQATSG